MAEPEPLPETPPVLQADHAVEDPDAELRRKNMLWGWGLLGLFCVLFGGTVGIAFVYLWLS